ncbi:Aminodeoxyfutalosine synthase [Pandoravirus macleodensis]|uniref:Aminodeoxyfutalosine synthase n=1 Tax=Pandoravirus macleodensis TaxID=2107707 RepID=A0A2U7UFW1_9VIRU|nr:Aminodeoxyfutalosine synthase [Pandoravirus macleodensis]AVK77388.1 Aminodeoxyfutalosine synthase [Pandoravirus macleodensis]
MQKKAICDIAKTSRAIASRGDPRLSAIADAVFARRPLTFEQGVYLYRHAPVAKVCRLADWRRRAYHGDHLYYSNAARLDVVDIDRQRRPRTHCLRQIHARTVVGDLLCSLLPMSSDNGIDDVVIASPLGAPPVPLPFDWWHNLVAAVHSIAPGARVNACASADVTAMAETAAMSVDAVLVRLAKSGLTSLGPDQMPLRGDKASLDHWLHVHERAHALGIGSEVALPNRARNRRCEQRVEQMLALRSLQEKSIAKGGKGFRAVATGSRTAFAIERASAATRHDDLRDRAIARLMLDNVQHILGPPLLLFGGTKTASARVIAAAHGGADDLGHVAPDNEGILRGVVDASGFSQTRRYTRYPFARVGWTMPALDDFYGDEDDRDGKDCQSDDDDNQGDDDDDSFVWAGHS